MKIVLYKILIFFKIHKIFQYINKNKLIILMYHGFTDRDHLGVENYLGLHIHKEGFEGQLRYLNKNYNIISLREAIDIISNNKKIQKNSVILTMDDGYGSNYKIAYPIIKELNVPVTIFLTTSFVDEKKFLWVDRLEYVINNSSEERLVVGDKKYNLLNVGQRLYCLQDLKMKLKKIKSDKRLKILDEIESSLKIKLNYNNSPEIYKPLSWNEIEEMQKGGLIDFGGHTHTHPILSQCNKEQIKNELLFSKNIIENNLKFKCKFFAYPNGQPEDFNDDVLRCLKDLGYKCAVTTVQGKNSIHDNLYKLKRYPVSNRKDLIEFKIILSGVSSFLNRLRKII